MQRKLYVGNLGYGVGGEELGRLFSGYGTVSSAEVVRYHNSPRSSGFGFVEMKTEEQSEAAIASLNGRRYGGHVLTVHWASLAESMSLRSI